MSYVNKIKNSIFIGIIMFLIFATVDAKAASSSLSGETTAKPGDTVYVSMSFSGSNTVAVGVIYSYNSCISSVSASNASPWGNTQADSSQNQIGVGDYNGYESGSWNYILNGSTTVVSFRLQIASDAVAGDVATLKLNTVYYATTSNTLEEVSNQNLPTAGTSSISITIVDDTPTATPTPEEQEENPGGDDTDVPNVTPEASESTPTPEPTATPEPTQSSTGNSGSSSSDFKDTTPIVPGEVFDTIDDNYYDSTTGGYVVAATRDDRGKTTVYEVATDENDDTVYIKKVINDGGAITEEVISEEQMNSEMSSTENYLADKDNKDSYSEASENVSAEESELSPAEKDVNGKINPKEFPVVALFAIVFGLIFIFGLIFFFIIRKFKEHKHTFTK
jgi:hypothetical protein